MGRNQRQKLPHFAKFLSILNKNQHKLGDESASWGSLYATVDNLIGILVENTSESLEKWWLEKGKKYDSSIASKLKKGEVFPHGNIKKYYLSLDSDKTFTEHIHSIAQNFDNLKHRPIFFNKEVCAEVIEYLNDVNTGSLSLEHLRLYREKGQYSLFFATVLFYIVTDMPSYADESRYFNEIIGGKRTFIDDIISEVESGKYYDYFYRSTVLIPNTKSQTINGRNRTEFASKILNFKYPDENYLRFIFNFKTPKEREGHDIVRIDINGKSYLEEISIQFKDKEKGVYPFCKIYTIKQVEKSDYYHIVRETHSSFLFPVAFAEYRLPYSAKKFRYEVKISSSASDDKMFFQLFGSLFLPFKKDNRLNMMEVDTHRFRVDIDEFTPFGSGVRFTIMPTNRELTNMAKTLNPEGNLDKTQKVLEALAGLVIPQLEEMNLDKDNNM